MLPRKNQFISEISNDGWIFVITVLRYYVIPTYLRIISGEGMGLRGNLGLIGAEIKKIISEQNKNSSTLFKISSEIKKLAPNYLRLFRRLFFILQKYCIIPMNKGRIAVENYMVPKPNSEINKNNSEIIKYSSDVF